MEKVQKLAKQNQDLAAKILSHISSELGMLESTMKKQMFKTLAGQEEFEEVAAGMKQVRTELEALKKECHACLNQGAKLTHTWEDAASLVKQSVMQRDFIIKYAESLRAA